MSLMITIISIIVGFQFGEAYYDQFRQIHHNARIMYWGVILIMSYATNSLIEYGVSLWMM